MAKKIPEARKEEFIVVASKLFAKNGYEETSVDDIVEEMGVAKGLFYYYFDSRDEILENIIQRMLDEVERSSRRAIEIEGLDTIGRLKVLLDARRPVDAKSAKLAGYFHQERNRQLHSSIENRVIKFFVPIMEQIIRQGIREGVFETDHPREAAVVFISSAAAISHMPREEWDDQSSAQRVKVFEYFSERILGARPGTFSFFSDYIPRAGKAKSQSSRK